MKKYKFYQISSGLFSIIAGLMLVLLRGSVLSLLITVVGIGFIVSGLAFGVKHITKFSILKIIIGICTIAFGNTYINLSMYILGIALIVLGIFQFFSAVDSCKRFSRNRYMLTSYIRPVLTLAAGVCILFNPMGSIESIFFVCGILLIAGGAWDLYLGAKLRIPTPKKVTDNFEKVDVKISNEEPNEPEADKTPYMSVFRVFHGSLGIMIVGQMIVGKISVQDTLENDRTGKTYKTTSFRYINSIQNFDETANDYNAYLEEVDAQKDSRMFVFHIEDPCDIEEGDRLLAE